MIQKGHDSNLKTNRVHAVVIAGSDSDKNHIDEIVKSLNKYEISHEVRICSAHKQPEKLRSMIDEYNAVEGIIAYIAVAGGTDALSGTLSFHALSPVISCPPDSINSSSLGNPSGSSNAYIARPGNVGRFIAQMYATINPRFKELLEEEKTKKINNLEAADAQFQKSYKME